ncbi:hypothetical protein [Paraburkholderia acidipaludis]|uniref:hypothetical protein n=1 Tax=Paraburkholderia acidipaludis TaxID=660537 RepID=UPI00047FB9EC|nr:hypothetical protein [Paraburkholderia acidipaludis]
MSDRLRSIVAENGGFPVSDEQCSILQKNHLAISVDGAATVLGGVNIGWAAVHLQDSRSNIISDKTGSATNINKDEGSQDTANVQFYKSLVSAINALDWNAASQEVTRYRSIAR